MYLSEANIPIKVRIALRDYCKGIKGNPSWVDFNKNWNKEGISEEDFNLALPLFTKLINPNANIPDSATNSASNNTKNDIVSPAENKAPKSESPKEDKVDKEEGEAKETKDANNDTLIIDGVKISNTSVFKISVPYIKSRFNTFNKMYFDNQLTLDGVQVKLARATRYFGLTSTYMGRYVRGLVISTAFGHNEFSYCSTIIHEMIHMWQAQVNHHIDGKGGHGPEFIRKMNEINLKSGNGDSEKGWKVSIRATTEEVNDMTVVEGSTIDVRIKGAYFVVRDSTATDKKFGFLWAKEACKQAYSVYQAGDVYIINNSEPFKTLPIRRKAYNRSGYSGRLYTEDEIKKFEDEGFIEKVNPITNMKESRNGLGTGDFEDPDNFIPTDSATHKIVIGDDGEKLDVWL